jgi:hypothetical protein
MDVFLATFTYRGEAEAMLGRLAIVDVLKDAKFIATSES